MKRLFPLILVSYALSCAATNNYNILDTPPYQPGNVTITGGTINGVSGTDIGLTVGAASNLSAGTAGQMPYQSAVGTTGFVGPCPGGQQIIGNGTGAPACGLTIPYADAGGSADTITVAYSPAITSLVDGMTLAVGPAYANITTTPTFSPNGLAAHTIVKNNGQSLLAGDIPGSSAQILLQYNATNTQWALLNPAIASSAASVAVEGVTGLGTGVASALAVNVGTAGAPVVNGGALGTPASGTATNLTGTATGLVAGSALLTNQTVTGTSHIYSAADFNQRTRRSNSGTAMTDTMPVSSMTGLIDGEQIEIVNVDSTASITLTAGAGTTIPASAVSIGPGRDVWLSYQAANTAWRCVANTCSELLATNNLSDVSSAATALANLGGVAASSLGTNVASALGIAIGSAGAPVLQGASYTFSTLPAANSVVVGQQYLVTDVGANGSYWYSNGSQWNPVNGEIVLFNLPLPKGICPSGSIAATTGVNTLGTAFDIAYPKAYCWLPAGAWTGSAAGMYPIACTTTTSCLVYSNVCAADPCNWPASPTLVTTGAGAYTQTTGVYLTTSSVPMPANAMGNIGSITASFISTTDPTVGMKSVQPTGPFNTAGLWETSSTTKTVQGIQIVKNMYSASNQLVSLAFYSPALASDSLVSQASTVNTGVAFNLTSTIYLATNTDWVMLQHLQYLLTR